ncbi:MAG: hypothetical protein ABS58_11790 [Mesorhizobium sp. SCN 65-20]|nr:MAG: hypothetical protein ABS58_11790 [Mesorhizobium sp. SCN 65-20]
MPEISIKRVYEAPSAEDGFRVLVDRVWPRGITRDTAAVDLWMKDIAPSTELRKWFGHDPERWAEFRRRYCGELEQRPELVEQLRGQARKGRLTLVYSARDETHNQAVVLKQALEA